MDMEHERRLTVVEDRSKSNQHRIDDNQKKIKELETRQDNLDQLVSSVAVMANEQKHIQSDVSDIKNKVDSIAEKPAKRWESTVDKIIWAVCAALIAFLLGRIGL